MSMVGKTAVKGHGLLNEGMVHYTAEGNLSPPGISQSAAKRWHREHKAEIVAAQQ